MEGASAETGEASGAGASSESSAEAASGVARNEETAEAAAGPTPAPSSTTLTTLVAQETCCSGVGVENPALEHEHEHEHEHQEGACACAVEKSSSACLSCAGEGAALEFKVQGSGIDPDGAVVYQSAPIDGAGAAPAAGPAGDSLAVCHCMDHVVLPNEIAVKACNFISDNIPNSTN